MAPMVTKLVVGLLFASMVASLVLVLSASRLRVQGGGVLAWTAGGLGGSVARARSIRSVGRAMERFNLQGYWAARLICSLEPWSDGSTRRGSRKEFFFCQK